MTSLERGPPSSLLWQLVLQIYLAVLYAGLAVKQVEAYDLVREYSGIPFFDRWDFYGSWDNLTSGMTFLFLSFSCHPIDIPTLLAQAMCGGLTGTMPTPNVWRISTMRGMRCSRWTTRGMCRLMRSGTL